MGDFLDKVIAKRTTRNPDFPNLVEEEMARLDREYPAPSDGGPPTTATAGWGSPNLEEHRPNLAESACKLAGQAKDLADRRKRKTPA